MPELGVVVALTHARGVLGPLREGRGGCGAGIRMTVADRASLWEGERMGQKSRWKAAGAVSWRMAGCAVGHVLTVADLACCRTRCGRRWLAGGVRAAGGRDAVWQAAWRAGGGRGVGGGGLLAAGRAGRGWGCRGD